MKTTAPVWVAILFIGVVMFTSNIYLFREVSRLSTENKSLYKPTASDIVALVDERISSLEKRKAAETLSKLEREFQLAPLSTPDDRLIYGKLDAKITLQEFGDIECPFCRKMHSGLKQVIDYSKGAVNWEMKHFPLGRHNPIAAKEAQAIECIREAYDNRTAWIALDRFIVMTNGNGKGVGDIGEAVRSFGLNGTLIENCLSSDDHKAKVNQDYSDGKDIGISSTPALRVLDNTNGKSYLIRGYKTPEQILQSVQQVLSQ